MDTCQICGREVTYTDTVVDSYSSYINEPVEVMHLDCLMSLASKSIMKPKPRRRWWPPFSRGNR